jgi:light-dependent protochlorophyllide reductase
MSKQYAVVTGCSPSSIGFLAAKALAAATRNFRVVLACRDPLKGKQAEEAIRLAYPESNALYMHLDLASMDSIKEFVQHLRVMDGGAVDKQGLSLLVNNAGVGWGQETPYVTTKDGLEEIVGVNHFGTFYLTHLLLDDLKKATDARVVVVASSLHDPNKFKSGGDDSLLLPDFPNGILQSEEDYDGAKAYKVSKLCNIWFTYELQRRLENESSSVRVNALSPGFIPTTGLTRRSGWFAAFFLHWILDPWRHLGLGVTRSPEDGAEVIVQTCTSPIAAKGGEYFERPRGIETIKPLISSGESYDEAKAKALWEMSLKICKL